MLALLAQNGFFIYEASFLLLAAGLVAYSLAVRRINLALRQPAYWFGLLLAAFFFLLCALIHPYVHLILSPQYLAAPDPSLLLLMYQLKMSSMALVLAGGLSLAVTVMAQWRQMRMPRSSQPPDSSPELP